MPSAIPERIAAAVDLLEMGPAEHVLEIGCGAGLAVEAVCDRLAEGTIAAVDRSQAQVELARRRNARQIAAGRASFAVAAADALPFPDAAFDIVFAIRVNVFWTDDATAELAEIERVLRPGGALRLFYDAPATGRATEIADRVAAALEGRASLACVRVAREPVAWVGAVRA